MLTAIVGWALRHRGVVVAMACILLGYALYSLRQAKYDVFPEFSPPEVVIPTEAPGLAPQQVELLVTQPIENAVVGVAGVRSVRSASVQGLSVITVLFNSNTNVYLNRQVIAERLSTLSGSLPAGITPSIAPLTTSTSVVMAVGLTSRTQSLMHLRTVADWTMKLRLLAVPGVSKIAVFGGYQKQFQVQISPQQLTRHEIGVEQVLAAARQATGIRGAGFITTPNQRMIVQSEGQATTSGELGQTVVLQQQGANLTLGSVAKVTEGAAPRLGAASVMAQPAVMLMISAQYGANTLDVSAGLDRALRQLGPALAKQDIQIDSTLFRPARFIDTALHNLRSSLIVGGILVIVVLFLFLFNLRTAAISCAAIPLSLLAATMAIERMGYTLNTMTLGGLAIAIGEVVDDAVIDVENIYRRLRENRSLPQPRSVFRVVLDASIEVRGAVVYATFSVILVFLPVLTMSGVAGRIFSPLAVTYIWAILASLVVALTITPALSMILLPRGELRAADPPLVHWLKGKYERVLTRMETHPSALVGTVAVLVFAALLAIPFLGAEFLPSLREGHFVVHMTAMPGTSLDQSMRLGDRVSEALLRIPYVREVGQRAGRAELSDDFSGTHSSEFEVDLRALSGAQTDRAVSDIRHTLASFPGAAFSVNTFLTERINEILSGYTGAVVVNVYGADLNELDREAARIAGVLARVPGAREVQIQSPPGMPQVVVRLRPADLARWGFDSVQVLDVIRTAFGGEGVGEIYQGNQVFPVSVILNPADRHSVPDIASLPLRSPQGNYVLLRQLADVYESSGRYVIAHQGGRRVESVTCNVAGGNIASFVATAGRRIARLGLPAGDYVEFSGTAEEQARSQRDLLVHSLLAGIGIIILLSIVMQNHRNLLLVLANLPFALVGGIFVALATGGNLSLGSLVGFVTLFGITLRNSIMLISHYEHLVREEGMEWNWATALRGASERLSPIVMTALVTGLGLLPLALGSGAPGREIEGPMAIIILGGLATSTALNLLVLPTLALRYGRFEPPLATEE
ncbi:MAG TPA: efflux RND transporter permease subunit [Terriglobales bacterium]|nr:efflux RND transporter permease subunit [Terriglobales bacterium]